MKYIFYQKFILPNFNLKLVGGKNFTFIEFGKKENGSTPVEKCRYGLQKTVSKPLKLHKWKWVTRYTRYMKYHLLYEINSYYEILEELITSVYLPAVIVPEI